MLRLLLVDSASDFRALWSAAFGSTYQTVAVENALEAYREHTAHAFDILICETAFGADCDGSLLRTLQDFHPITGLALTTGAFPSDLERSRLAGFSLHLTKPASLDDIEKAIFIASQYAEGERDPKLRMRHLGRRGDPPSEA